MTAASIIQAAIANSDTIVHFGAGKCRELPMYLAHERRQVILVEPNPKLVAALAARAKSFANVTVMPYAVSDRAGQRTLNVFSLPECSSLHDASGILKYYPGLRKVDEVSVSVRTPADILAGLNHSQVNDACLIIDTPGEGSTVMKALAELATAKFANLHKLVILDEGCDLYDTAGVTEDEALALLCEQGYENHLEVPGESPLQRTYVLRHNPWLAESRRLRQKLECLESEPEEQAHEQRVGSSAGTDSRPKLKKGEANLDKPRKQPVASTQKLHESPGRGEESLQANSTIVVAGMRHCGSTVLFNVVRIALQKLGIPFASCYADYPGAMHNIKESDGVRLIKVHEFRDDVACMADFVLTCRRDLRDTVASAVRRDFLMCEMQGGAVGYAKYNRTLHDMWAPQSDYEFNYERFMRTPELVVAEVLDVLRLSGVDTQQVYAEAATLPTDDYQHTLLSPYHITDKAHALTFRDTLGCSDIRQIEEQHFCWLGNFGYQLATTVGGDSADS